MKIEVNKHITIYCEIKTAWMTGNAYHHVLITCDLEDSYSEDIHGCEDGYEAIFYVLNHMDKDNDFYKVKNEMLEAVNSHYLMNSEE